MRIYYPGILPIILLLAGLAISGCTHPETELGPIPAASWIKISASLDRDSYYHGQEVKITLRFRNTGDQESVIKVFPPSVMITPSDKYGINLRDFPEGNQSLSLGAGQEVVHNLVWNQLDEEGQQVPFGKYQVILGNIKVDNQQMLLSLDKIVEINIVSSGH